MKKVFDPIFLAHYLIQIGGDIQKGLEKYSELIGVNSFIVERTNRKGHFFSHTNHKGGFVWIKDKKDIETVAHEAFHATYHVLTHTGVILKEESEEIFAYYLGWLVKEILK